MGECPSSFRLLSFFQHLKRESIKKENLNMWRINVEFYVNKNAAGVWMLTCSFYSGSGASSDTSFQRVTLILRWHTK